MNPLGDKEFKEGRKASMWTFGKPMNKQPFEHLSTNGTRFKCARCDFKKPIEVDVSLLMGEPSENLNLILQDVSEMIAYHTLNIFPELNGFSGYGSIKYKLK